MIKLLILTLIFSGGLAVTLSAQDNKKEELRTYLDSLKASHMERAEQMRREMMERISAHRDTLRSSENKGNLVMINGREYSAKDSLQIHNGEGSSVLVKGDGNHVIIESREKGNTVIVSQSGKGSKASIHQSGEKYPMKDEKYNPH